MSVVRHSWTFQKKFSILNLQYARIELSFNADFLRIGKLQQKQPIAGGISKILFGAAKSFLLAADFHGHEL